MNKILSAITLLFLVGASAASLQARIDLLLVPPRDPVPGVRGVAFTLHLNNPTEFDETVVLPLRLEADYASSAGHSKVALVLANPNDARRIVFAMTRVTIELRLAEPLKGAAGFASLRLTNPATNAIMFELDPAAPAPAPPPIDSPLPPTPPPRHSPVVPGRHLDLTSDLEATRRHISSYDPIYFAVGSRERLNAHFQFSFKYRVFEPGAPGEPCLEQLARDLYVAYTQTSIWDLETFSKPFYDSSYKPTVFLLHEFRDDTASNWLLRLQAGAQHESNGKGGGAAPTSPGTGLSTPATALKHPSDSRSFNTLYFAAKTRWSGDSGLFFEVGARTSAYFQIDENPDIARYRGYVELTLRGGYDRGFQLSADVRGNPRGYGSAEFNATWPAIETPFLKLILPRTLGGYAQIQYFNGYGESLLDYDVRRKDQLRFGLMIVR